MDDSEAVRHEKTSSRNLKDFAFDRHGLAWSNSEQVHFLTLSRPLLSYGYSYKGLSIKVPGCQKLQMTA